MVRLIGRIICSKKVVEDFWDIHFSCAVVKGRIVDSDMNGFSTFSGNFCTILGCYLEVGDVCSGMVVGNTVLVNCSGDMTVLFFYSIFKTSVVLPYVGKVAIFFSTKPF